MNSMKYDYFTVPTNFVYILSSFSRSPDQFNRVSIVIVECSRLPHSCVVVAWSMMISCASINIGLCIRLNVWIKNQVEIALIPLQIQEMSIVKRRMISPKLSKNSKHSTPATGQWWIIV
uniref:Uncharacterized protein n=1 Tax=Cacopsylla melanoneura TaxID=428564 RepID=A0A8D8VPE9_9HEMI